MNIVRAALSESVGEYFGEGVNHEGQAFKGTYQFSRAVPSALPTAQSA